MEYINIGSSISGIKTELDNAFESSETGVFYLGGKTGIVGKDCTMQVARLKDPEIYIRGKQREHSVRISGDVFATPFKEYEKIVKKRHSIKYGDVELWPAIVDEYIEKDGRSDIMEHLRMRRRLSVGPETPMFNDLKNIHSVYPISDEGKDGVFLFNFMGNEMQPLRGYIADEEFIDDPLQPLPLPVGIKAREAKFTFKRGKVRITDGRKIESGDKTVENALFHIDNIESSINYERKTEPEEVRKTEKELVSLVSYLPYIPTVLATEFLVTRFRVPGLVVSGILLYYTYKLSKYIRKKYGTVEVKDIEKRMPYLHTEISGEANLVSDFMGTLKVFEEKDFS